MKKILIVLGIFSLISANSFAKTVTIDDSILTPNQKVAIAKAEQKRIDEVTAIHEALNKGELKYITETDLHREFQLQTATLQAFIAVNTDDFTYHSRYHSNHYYDGCRYCIERSDEILTPFKIAFFIVVLIGFIYFIAWLLVD